MEMLQGVWKQHLRPRAVVGYGLKIFLPSPPNYVTRSPGGQAHLKLLSLLPTSTSTTNSPTQIHAPTSVSQTDTHERQKIAIY